MTDTTHRRQEAEDRLAVAKATLEAQQFERAAQLLESPQPVVVPWREYPGYEDFDRWPTSAAMPYTSIDDRTGPRYRPYYETETDLRRIRAQARRFEALFPVARGLLESLTNYVIGSGFEFTAQPLKKDNGTLAARVQAVVDEFIEDNDIEGEVDRETHRRARVDGEVFLTLYKHDGSCELDLTPPDFISQPKNTTPLEQFLRTSHKINHWWHGVHTTHCLNRKRDDVVNPLGYFAAFDTNADEWDYLPVSRVEHIKERTVGRDARRGVSDFFTVMEDLENEAKLRRNTAVGAAILAAIVLIRQWPEGTTQSSVESMIAGNRTGTREQSIDGGTRTLNVTNTSPGTVKDAPKGMEMSTGPLGSLRSPVYIEVAQYVARIIGNRWNSPEYMTTGDASNANFASTLVAESPYVKAREADQAFYGRHWISLLWKVIRIAADAGRFGQIGFEQIHQAIELKADYPDVASRDKEEQSQRNQRLNQAGILSRRTWATSEDLDYDEEQREIAKEPPPVQSSPFGEQPENPLSAPRLRTEQLAQFAINRLMEDCGTGAGGFKGGNTCAKGGGTGSIRRSVKAGTDEGPEKGAAAIFKGEKFRVASKRARLNVDQVADLMKERGYKVGKPEFNFKLGATLYPVEGHGKRLLLPAKKIAAFLSTERDEL